MLNLEYPKGDNAFVSIEYILSYKQFKKAMRPLVSSPGMLLQARIFIGFFIVLFVLFALLAAFVGIIEGKTTDTLFFLGAMGVSALMIAAWAYLARSVPSRALDQLTFPQMLHFGWPVYIKETLYRVAFFENRIELTRGLDSITAALDWEIVLEVIRTEGFYTLKLDRQGTDKISSYRLPECKATFNDGIFLKRDLITDDDLRLIALQFKRVTGKELPGQ